MSFTCIMTVANMPLCITEELKCLGRAKKLLPLSTLHGRVQQITKNKTGRYMQQKKNQAGFTLVELAIVLVIIGLIIGGVLVGQDLIKAATIRAAQTDIEKTNAGATAFLSKYSGLPGDLLASKASEFGLLSGATGGTLARDGTAAHGDGNGQIEGCAVSTSAQALGCETALFWVDLSTATLIPGKFTTFTNATPGYAASITTTIGSYLPKQRLRDSANVTLVPLSGRNFFYLGSISTTAAGLMTAAASLTPGEARAIDEKLDDAYPTTGIVQSYNMAAGVAVVDPGTGAPAATTCMDSVAPAPATTARYNVIPANINNVNCQLLIRTSF
jgi:prepilin-type N-terminal cleavage/methylation domain-containing protein